MSMKNSNDTIGNRTRDLNKLRHREPPLTSVTTLIQSGGKITWHSVSITASVSGDFRAGIAQSVKRLATGWTVRGVESRWRGGEILRTRPDRPWGPPSILYNGYRVFPGTKRPRRGVYHPPPSRTEVQEEVELHLYFTSGRS